MRAGISAYEAWFARAFVVLCFTLVSADSRAQDETRPERSGDIGARTAGAGRNDPTLEQALRLERDGDLVGALELLTALASSEDASTSSVANERAAWLRERAEGNFAPLRALMAVQSSPVRSSSPTDLAALDEAALAFPPGRARIETHGFVAHACVRAGCPAVAALAARRLLDEPLATPSDKERARSALLALGNEVGAGVSADPSLVAGPKRVELVLRIRLLASRLTRVAEIGVVIPVIALVLGLAHHPTRRALREGLGRVVVTCTMLPLGGLAARAFDPAVSVAPFVLLAIGFFVVDRGVLVLTRCCSRWSSKRYGSHVSWGVMVFALFSALSVAVLSLACSDDALLERTLLREPR